MALKVAAIFCSLPSFGCSHNDAVRIAFLLPQGGEFGFVLFTAAAAAAIFAGGTASLLIAVVTLSMALTPLFAALSKRLLKPPPAEETGRRISRAPAPTC